MAHTAESFIAELGEHASEAERGKIATRVDPRTTTVIGVRMGTLFATAKAYASMPLGEVENLLASDEYEARMGAVCILDFKARRRGLSGDERRELFEMYLSHHDRIDTWDMVDRAAPRVLGLYLQDTSREVLYELAASDDVWRRRSAITATFTLIRSGDIEDALALADRLIGDEHHFVHTNVGVALREVGVVDTQRLLDFLTEHTGQVQAVTLRMATEKLEPELRRRIRAQVRGTDVGAGPSERR